MLRKYQGYSWESRTNPTRTQKTLQLWINVNDSPVEPRATVSIKKGVFDPDRGCEGSYKGRLISTLMAGKSPFQVRAWEAQASFGVKHYGTQVDSFATKGFYKRMQSDR